MSDWSRFCERISVLGEGLEGEGVRHLANQVACWLTYAIGHTDPAHPAFFRSSDLVYQWGGPNADQVARRAMISGAGTYRISGHMGSCEEFILQIKLGLSQSGGAGIATEISGSSLGIGPGDDFTLVLAATEPPDLQGSWIPLDPAATFVHIRDYYFDWQPADPATFVIERLDELGARPPLDVAALLDDAASEIEHSISFWSGYQDKMLAGQEPNTFGPPAPTPRGVKDILYSHAGIALADGQALVVDLDDGGARLWDIQLYNRPYYEALDFANRITCLNHRLAKPGPIVIAAADPGGPNWLDTEDRESVLATIRWWGQEATPSVSARVVPTAELDLAAVDRAGELRRRASHVAWRYRT
jgi:hypothetical protein